MKISCQTCQAKYTIADEKVAGKVVKIKCKKCGSTIVVNGNDAGAAPPEDHGHAPAGGAQDDDDGATKIFMEPAGGAAHGGGGADDWTVNVTDEDQRTMTSAVIAIEIAKGVVTRDTYVWKDGMADWLPVAEVPDLAAFLAVAPAAAAPAPAPAAVGGLGGTMMMEQSPVAAARPAAVAAAPAPAAAAPAAGAARRAGARPGNVDLFGGSSEPAAAAPPGASGDKHVGERNENSVLFSLSALTATENAAKVSKKDDAVLDLSPSKPRNGGRAGFDDIMNLGGGGIGGGMGASPALAPPPLLAPVVEAPPPQAAPAMQMAPSASGGLPYSSPTPAKKSPVGIIVGAVIALAIIGGVAVFAMKGSAPPPVASATPDATNAPTTQVAAAPSAAPSATPTAAAADTTTPSAAPGDTSAPSAVANGGKAPVGGPLPAGAPAGKATSAPAATTAAAAVVAPPPAADTGTPAPAAPAGGAPSEFNRGAASAALESAAGGAKGCKKADGPTGQGRVKVTFAPSGNVTTAQVDGPPFAGTSVGGCVASAFRSAHVPPFDGSPVTVSKSFTIN